LGLDKLRWVGTHWWVGLDFSHLKWASTVDSIVPVVALIKSPAVLPDVTVMVLITDSPMVTAFSWWWCLDFSHLKWASTVDGIVVMAALVKSPALLMDVTVVITVTDSPMVAALVGIDFGFLGENVLGLLHGRLFLGKGSFSWSFSWSLGLDKLRWVGTHWWSGLDLSHLKWASTVDGIVPVVALIKSPAVGPDITVVILVAGGPMVTAFTA
jgi:hypothetical protein